MKETSLAKAAVEIVSVLEGRPHLHVGCQDFSSYILVMLVLKAFFLRKISQSRGLMLMNSHVLTKFKCVLHGFLLSRCQLSRLVPQLHHCLLLLK